jgi:hypothetical protein
MGCSRYDDAIRLHSLEHSDEESIAEGIEYAFAVHRAREACALLLLAGIALAPLPARPGESARRGDQAPSAPGPISSRRSLVGKMTLDEKFDQLLNTAPAIERLGIAGL